MSTQADSAELAKLVRTSILVGADTDKALRALADEGHRPLSWEIRAALEHWVEHNSDRLRGVA